MRFDWIASQGGPLIIISENSVKLWSGIYKRDSYLVDKVEEAHDFLNSTETDYGKACLINDYLGIVSIGPENGLVLGDEPMLTTIFNLSKSEIGIARWSYGTDAYYVDNLLSVLDLTSIDNWNYNLTVNFNSDKQYLFDAAIDGKELDNQKVNTDFLLSQLIAGQYKVFTAIYEPDPHTKLFLHRLSYT